MSFLQAPVGLAALWGCAFALLNRHLADFPYIFLAVIEEALPRALLLGVPTALVLRSRGLLTFRSAVGSATVIGAIPIGTVYQWFTAAPELPYPAAMRIDVTEPFWQLLLEMSIGGAIFGAAGGVLWWFAAKPGQTATSRTARLL